MKRHGNLYGSVTDFGNLLAAARQAQRGKRFREDVLEFNYDLEGNLHALQEELRGMTYQPGPYKTFVIYEPKRRLISAAPYGDRVVHHALCNVIGPLFDATLTDSCFANRTGRGTHRALDRFVALARSHRFVLQADVQKHFPSMDHQILKELVRRKIKCAGTLWLIDLILDNSNEQEPVMDWYDGDDLLTPAERRHGLPIGNLTSQMWANVYLNPLDQRMCQVYGGRRYVRYVDDIALFSDDASELREAREAMRAMLARQRMRLHPVKTQIVETRVGMNFLGFRILPDRIRLRQENLRRARRRLRRLQADFRDGNVSAERVTQSIQSWAAHAAYGNTWRLREKIFSPLAFARG